MQTRVWLGDRKKTAAQPQITATLAVCRDNAARSAGDARKYTDNHLNSRLFPAGKRISRCRGLWQDCHIQLKFVQFVGCQRLFGYGPLSAAESRGTIFPTCVDRAWRSILGGWVMSFHGMKAVLLACSGITALIAATADANAGGLAVREQSAYGQGSSFAGIAAGGDLSGMFWNPAVMTQFAGIQSSATFTGILPYAANTPGAGSSFFGFLGGTGNTADSALVPAAYYSYQLNPSLWLGMSVNSPFGLSVKFPDAWAGRNYAAGSSSLKTYNATPSIAYRINDMISIGLGVQIERARADFTSGLPINGIGQGFPNSLGNQFNVYGYGWGIGFTGGVTLTPTPTTTIGLGYRSAINQKINGTMTLPPGPAFTPPGSTPGSVIATLNLPDIVSLGIRQRVNPQLILLGTVEWTNWSRIGTTAINQPNGAPSTIVGNAVTLPFQYKDGWFFSAGAEYQWSEQLMVRSGVGYEKSPITDQVRTPLLPDNDRLWLSAGATYKLTPKMSFDLAYSHIFVKSTSVNVVAGNPWWDGVNYIGDVSSHVDIISVAMNYRWDNPAPAPESKLYHK
jgi:long-chain fatty acid transport protein